MDITLTLDSVEHLFTEQPITLANAGGAYVAGVDQIITALKPTALRQNVHVALRLPHDQIEPGTRQALQDALARYCRYKIYEHQVELLSLRWQGLKALQTGVIFLAACLFLSALTGALETLPEGIRTLLGEGFLIAGWVSMWHPIEILLYEWWPAWRSIQIYRKILSLEVAVAGYAR